MDRTRATRQALVAAARPLFADRGYAAVPTEEIVAAAGLTRGALRHHFGDKSGLFQTVFEQVESEVNDRVTAALAGADDAWTAAVAALAAFLDACEDPEVVRIALTDAPAVLGWETWRAIEARYGLGLVTAGLDQAMAEGVIVRQPVTVLAHLVLGAAIEAALLVGRVPEPGRAAARAEAEQTLLALLGGLRTARE
ncbi:TetR/AcrR family transcriptional regulator [Streptomyces sp. B1866]|uniref:TetR/AcrR family transcriptional regulator n=1 Tax=Streptomyces sp. B1866 TaxID=3075431 RepID=UPI00288D5E15|nr:TetR/AcrR family transcriptional regulator [Streptomyces sp. B1866]MDT3398438.1 TetR/AcrR family transcriptional regulator [Streptomyces sp. B1866]